MRVWTPSVRAVLWVMFVTLLLPIPSRAIPAFARKYGVKCYQCHTVPPALNKNCLLYTSDAADE